MKELTLNIKRSKRRNSDRDINYHSLSQSQIDQKYISRINNANSNKLDSTMEFNGK